MKFWNKNKDEEAEISEATTARGLYFEINMDTKDVSTLVLEAMTDNLKKILIDNTGFSNIFKDTDTRFFVNDDGTLNANVKGIRFREKEDSVFPNYIRIKEEYVDWVTEVLPTLTLNINQVDSFALFESNGKLKTVQLTEND